MKSRALPSFVVLITRESFAAAPSLTCSVMAHGQLQLHVVPLPGPGPTHMKELERFPLTSGRVGLCSSKRHQESIFFSFTPFSASTFSQLIFSVAQYNPQLLSMQGFPSPSITGVLEHLFRICQGENKKSTH